MRFHYENTHQMPARRGWRLRARLLLVGSLAALALPIACRAQTAAAIYLIGDGSQTIHLSDRAQGDHDRLLIAAVPALATPLRTPLTTPPDAPSEARPVQADVAQIVRQAAEASALDPRLVHAVIATESGYALRAVSPRGAQGLMQLMPATARHYGVADPFNAAQNVRAGTAHLRSLLDRFGQNTALALAAYNAGAGAVERHGHRVPPFAETTAYVQRVLRRYESLRNPATHTTLARTS
jgi:soluble lytic murein transglycosylase-like protein